MRTSLATQRSDTQCLLASSGLPLMTDADEAAYGNLKQVIDEWTDQRRPMAGRISFLLPRCSLQQLGVAVAVGGSLMGKLTATGRPSLHVMRAGRIKIPTSSFSPPSSTKIPSLASLSFPISSEQSSTQFQKTSTQFQLCQTVIIRFDHPYCNDRANVTSNGTDKGFSCSELMSGSLQVASEMPQSNEAGLIAIPLRHCSYCLVTFFCCILEALTFISCPAL